MANTKIEQLKSKASTIKNEVEEGRNTANRIGGAFSDVAEILDSQDQDLESQKEELSDSKKKISLVARGTIESSKIDTLNSMVSEGLYVLTGQATNMSHLLVTSASNGWIYQYLFGPFNVSANGVPATEGGASQNTIGVRFYNKSTWSEWKYVDLSYLSGIKEVITGIQTEISSIELTTEKVMEGGKSQKSINEETAASINDLAQKTDNVELSKLNSLGFCKLRTSIEGKKHRRIFGLNLNANVRYKMTFSFSQVLSSTLSLQILDSEENRIGNYPASVSSTFKTFELPINETKNNCIIDLYYANDISVDIEIIGNEGVVLSNIKSWILSEDYLASNIVRNNDGLVTSLTATYPDGETGNIEITRNDEGLATLVSAIYRNVRYNLNVVRDSNGDVTSTNFN